MKKYLFSLIVVFCATMSSLFAQHHEGEENFDHNWLFARYGLQAEGGRIPEPGKIFKCTLTASSEEDRSGDMPQYAMDNDEGSYWQPMTSDKQPWIQADLENSVYVHECKIKSEGESKSISIKGSNDGRDWQELPGEFKHIRITVEKENKPFKVKEIELLDKEGKVIKNELLPSVSPEQAVFDDSKWRKLDVPHDWGVEGPFRMDLDGYTGKLPWRGIGWYRKHFNIPSSDKGKQFYLDFDGAMANAEVWLNGEKVGGWPYGYSSFRVDLTPHIKFDEDNVVAVRLNTEKLGSRWYPGAGIYRHVRLVKTDPVHVAHWGVFVTTPEINNQYAIASVMVKLSNNLTKKVDASYSVGIYELDHHDKVGKKAAESDRQKLTVEAKRNNVDHVKLKISSPKLWSLEETNRYLARVTVYHGNEQVDVYDAPFGIRTIEFTHDNGFLLNGKRVQLNGTCNHHDLGALGAAVNTSALERQLTILKSFGCNALRTAHNPPAPELLTLADKMGFLVMDEAFDAWEKTKVPNDYSTHFKQWHRRDLEMLVCRDRNHPSVIMWSSGNEVHEQYDPKLGIVKHLCEIINGFDNSRPATFGASYPSRSAMNGTELQVDVHGMNYAPGVYGGPNFYGKFLNKKGHEHLSGYASETSSTMSSRGEYFPRKFHVSSYDLRGPGWGSSPDQEFAALDKHPGICGEFVWTGFDYLGEPTPFNSDFSILLNHAAAMSSEQLEKEKEALEKIAESRPPSRSSYFGIVDMAGFPKDRFYLYQSRWMPNLPMVHILPHWNFPDRVGKETPVSVYTSGDEAELFLNGKSLGRKKKGEYEYRLRWKDVVYEPGQLKAVAYKNGKQWAETTVKTTGEATKLKLVSDKTSIKSDGDELAFVTVSVTDDEGNMVPTAQNKISCRLEGDGQIVATDNGDPTCHITFSKPDRPAFNGLLLVIVKANSKSDTKGSLKLTVQSEGLKEAAIEINKL